MSSAPPVTAASDPAEGLALVMPGRRASISEAISWTPRSWAFFCKAPVMWIVGIVIFLVASAIFHVIPPIGLIATSVIAPVYFAGFAVGCRRLETGGNLELEHLFTGFRTRSADLLVIGAVYAVGVVVILSLFLATFIGLAGWAIIAGFWAAVSSYNPLQAADLMLGMLVPLLLALLFAALLVVPLLALYWFAPCLVIMHGVKPVAAMKASFMACIRNFFPMFVYGVVMFALAFVATIPSIIPFLGWLVTCAAYVVLGAMSVIGIYVSYRDIFTDETSRPASATVTL